MSGSSIEGKGIKVVLQKDGCKLDKQLIVLPPLLSWELLPANQSRNRVSTFPCLKSFINLACIAYKNHKGTSLTYPKNTKKPKSSAGKTFVRCLKTLKLYDVFDKLNLSREKKAEEEDEEIVHELSQLGFEFLVEAKNKSNGYRGVAYINKIKRQVILSHRGTEMTNLGAVCVDIKNIWWGAYTSHLSSAITFAHHVTEFVQRNNCQIFFTGHSLGAWLAQITCFSTKYLTTNESGHFVRKPMDLWDNLHPYTVVFDSPGALEFLLRMKNDFILRNEPQSQMQVNVSCLPVEVFQFYPNSVNAVNTQIGWVYLVDIDKVNVTHSFLRVDTKFLGVELQMAKSVVVETHWKDPVRKLVASNVTDSEENVLTHQVLDYRTPKTWNDTFVSEWVEEGRSVDVKLSRFPAYFLTNAELELLKKQSETEVDGFYEGLSSEDEETANLLVKVSRREDVFVEGCVLLGEELDRREAIPLVRHFLQTLKTQVIWWNPRKQLQLGVKYIPRVIGRMGKSHNTVPLTKNTPTIELIQATIQEVLTVLVDSPGMGKTSEVTVLEQKLRNHFTNNRLILRVNLMEAEKQLATILEGESVTSVLKKLAPFLPQSSLQIANLLVFVLLDGLDEVCPKHKDTMVRLLHTFSLSGEPIKLHTIVTTRPHLRSELQSEFGVASWSLLPVTIDQQLAYAIASGVSTEEFDGVRSQSSSLEGLLGNPLMLFMLMEVLKSKAGMNSGDMNIYDLYSQFVEAKHELHCVEKLRMPAASNLTDEATESMMVRNLPYYYHIATEVLLRRRDRLSRDFTQSLQTVATEVSSATPEREAILRRDLLRVGLLVEDKWGQLTFKHLSFAEYFYARLLIQENGLNEAVKDTLFGSLYDDHCFLQNVEVFVAAFVTSKITKLRVHQIPWTPLLPIRPQWLSIVSLYSMRFKMLHRFVSSKLFPLLAREVLNTLINSNSFDFWENPLHSKETKLIFNKLFRWMNHDEVTRTWTREELLKISPDPAKKVPSAVANLIVATSFHFQSQRLFNEAEVALAMRSIGSRLLFVTAIQTERQERKWDFVERLLGGENKVKELIMNANDYNLSRVLGDCETAWKIVSTFSVHELTWMFTSEEKSVSDIVGRIPQVVAVALGEEFVPSRMKLPQFRGKSGNTKGKSIFEMGGVDFALDILWEDLVREMEEDNSPGPVTTALRDAFKSDSLQSIMNKMEVAVMGKRRINGHSHDVPIWKDNTQDGSARLIEWLMGDSPCLGKNESIPTATLPFVVRYAPSYANDHMTDILQKSTGHLNSSWAQNEMLKCFILSSYHPEDGKTSSCFSQLAACLKQNISSLQPEFRVLVEAPKEMLITSTHPLLVREVSVWLVFLKCLPDSPIPSLTKKTWINIASDVIGYAPLHNFSDLPRILEKLRRVIPDEETLKEVLMSCDVIWKWQHTFSAKYRTTDCDIAGLTHLTSFYFSVFGLNFDWMNMVSVGGRKLYLVGILPVELAAVLAETPSTPAAWRGQNLLNQFQQLLREFLRKNEVNTVQSVFCRFHYRTTGEWESFLHLIGEEFLQLGTERNEDFGHSFVERKTKEGFPLNTKTHLEIPTVEAAPLIRALIKTFGEQKAKEVLSNLWDQIHFCVENEGDSVESLGSVLHSAIELGEVEEVGRRAFPGLLKWRNSEGKTALEFGREKLGAVHVVTTRLTELTNLLNRQSNA